MKSFVSLLCACLALVPAVRGSTVTANFTSATTVPVTAASYTATGNDVNLALSFAPPTGTTLTVVKTTGAAFINGRFSNLAQGQTVTLSYSGTSYRFVANYYGGTGNDLVLQAANGKAYAWGRGTSGQLGNNGASNSSVPVAITATGVLAGKTITSLAAGNVHNLALCSDGTVAAWGANTYGQLGNNSLTSSIVPVAVTATGILAGKTVIAISAGYDHSLALCSDGTVAAWGYNVSGQLGNATNTSSSVPVAVTSTGILSGKTVTAICAGNDFSLALCSDGTLASWGNNGSGQLGIGSSTSKSVPTAVTTTGVLAGKTVVAVAAGGNFCLAACSDGTVASWGGNLYGQLGTGNNNGSTAPVAVSATGVLAGKTVTAVATGYYHSLALCSDGTLATWGYNYYGQLGNNTTTDSSAPVAITTAGTLAGKTVTSISAGYYHGVALCADGSIGAWGSNAYGQLGNNTTNSSSIPVAVSASALGSGEKFAALAVAATAYHTVALAEVPLSNNSSLSALALGTGTLSPAFSAGVTAYTARLAHGTSSLTVTPTVADARSSMTVNGTPLASGATSPPLAVAPGTVITITVTAQNGTTTSYLVTVRDDSTLANLSLGSGTLVPAFSPEVTSYAAYVSPTTAAVTVTPTAADGTTSIRVNGNPLASGVASDPVSLAPGGNAITVAVTALDGSVTQYGINVIRQVPLAFTYDSAGSVPVTAASYTATENTVSLSLGYAPAPGTTLTVVHNTGGAPIAGRFSNLAQGQMVALTYNNATYNFIANYFGGAGNDLVLQWARDKVYSWGYNSNGQLGTGNRSNSGIPVAVVAGGSFLPETKGIRALSAGGTHSLALCADGTLLSWGGNSSGQLGIGSTTDSSAAVPVSMTGALAGKTILAISAGDSHSLALCADGTLAAWGANSYGQLGNGNTTASSVPVAITSSGVLAGKTVIAISAGRSHSLALCKDGTLATWGYNNDGELGNNSFTNSSTPVAVTNTGVLAGKAVVAIGAGTSHNLVLCSDGSLATWGYNVYGQLGNNSTAASSVPVAVNTTGILSGKSATAIAVGGNSCLALCADGTLAAWGRGLLGNGTSANSKLPVAVTTSGVLAGKTITAIAAGAYHFLALCSDGSIAAWGSDYNGQLGDNNTTDSNVPVVVITTNVSGGEVITAVSAGSSASHAFITTAAPLSNNSTLATLTLGAGTLSPAFSPAVTTYTARTAPGATSLTFTATAAENNATLSANGTPLVSGAASPPIPISPGNHIITITVTAPDRVGMTAYQITVQDDSTLAGLGITPGTLLPAFSPSVTSYNSYVSGATTAVTLSPTAADGTATIRVNGNPLTPGTDSGPLALAPGANTFTVTVTALDGTMTSYGITVTRQTPLAFTFASAAAVAVTAPSYAAAANTVSLALGFAPATGTRLTVIRNTGTDFITGQFSNLAQGQTVILTYNNASYRFVANYFGGSGNDLVLEWADVKIYAWGNNPYAVLGDGSISSSGLPIPVTTGLLTGKTVTALAEGYFHGLALCADGTLVAWGSSMNGQLGNGVTNYNSNPPADISSSGALAGKTVIAIAAGYAHNLALCSDGTLVAWGLNSTGQLGIGNTTDSNVPVAVTTTGILADKHVVAIAAGYAHSLALCADGTLVAWGYNIGGQLGNGTTTDSYVPVAVTATGALAGKSVTAIAAGFTHNLALCSDGTIAAWGGNYDGELGDGSNTDSMVPVATSTGSGALAGKTVVAIATGDSHSIALCSDGTLATWGANNSGQLGDGTNDPANLPVNITSSGVLAGKTVISISGGQSNTLALCADGTLATWGNNQSGQLGDGSVNWSRTLPGSFSATSLGAGEMVLSTSVASTADYFLARVAVPLSNISTLSALDLSSGTLSPAFSSATTSYATTLPGNITSVTVAPTATDPAATIKVNGTPVTSGSASPPIPFGPGATTITVTVAAPNGIAITTYTINIDNIAPTFAGYAVATPYQTAVTLSFAKILAKASDANGDAISVTGAGAPTHGGSSVLNATSLTYTPPAGFSGTDTFPLTITDARGATVTGAITITVQAPASPTAGGIGANPPTITPLPDGKMGVTGHGIPGRTYLVQRSTDLNTWQTMATLVAAANGSISYTDDNPPQPSAFYRLALP